jgi:Dockerin type I domain
MRNLTTVVMVVAAVLLVAAPMVSAAVDKVICVPWQGDPAKQHTAVSGTSVQLKGVLRTTDTSTVWYRWILGDGNQTAVTPLSGSTVYNLTTTYTYTLPSGTPITAELQVDGVDSSMTNAVGDPYFLKIEDNTLDARVNMAIDRGLWYLYTHHAVSGSYWYWSSYSSYYASATASAVQAFEINNHKETGDGDQDPYVEAVTRGLDYLIFARLQAVNISVQVHGNPDTNGNGRGIDVIEGNDPYTVGQIMDALIATGTPDADCGRNLVGDAANETYKELVQDMCDVYSYGQDDYGSNAGGWQYSWNASSDNSACAWAAIGLIPAEQLWSCNVPAFVKTQNDTVWLNYSYNAGGRYWGYTYSGNLVNSTPWATRPSGLIQMVMSSGPGYKSDPRWVNVEGWYANTTNWNQHMANRSYYGWYAFVKAMRLSNTDTLSNGFNWYRGTNGIAEKMVNDQESDGSWPSSGHITHPRAYGDNFVTAWAIGMLRPALFQAAPIAHYTASPNPTYSDGIIEFDPSTSGHSEGGKDITNLTKFEWDWDNDGVYDEETPSPAVATHSFHVEPADLPMSFPVTLRVTDDHVPPLTAAYTLDIEISNPPHPPVADANGPYIVSQCPSDSLTVDGSGSYDPNEGEHEAGNPGAPDDTITAWDWDFVPPLTDFSDASGETVTLTAAQVASTFPPGTSDIGLQVTDNTLLSFPGSGEPNLTDADFTTVRVSPPCLGCELTATAGCNSVVLEWTVAGTYDVLRSTEGPNSGFAVIDNTTGLGYADLNVVNGVTYWYRLTDGQCLTTFAEITYQSDLAQCLLIDDLTARAKNALVQLRWSHLAGTAYYRVYRSTTTPCEITPANLLLDNLVTTWCVAIDTTCVNNVTYYYEVVAVSALTGQPSGLSNEASAMPHELTIPPPPSEAPIPITITAAALDRTWLYQNYGQAEDLHQATLTVVVDPGDIGEQYEVIVQATEGAASVVIVPTGDPHTWTIQGGAYNTTQAAAVDIEVQVTGLTTGYRDNRVLALEIRGLGDIDGNGVIGIQDKLELNRFLNGIETTAGIEQLDLTGDGIINTVDKLLINRLLNGIPLQ